MAWRHRFAARVLRAGGVIAYPTEAVYGLGCDPWNREAVAHLFHLKERSPGKGLILVAADLLQLAPFVALPTELERLDAAIASWPGPVTWLFPAAPHTPEWLTGGRGTIAVRVSAHPVAAALCRAFGGAIVSTSANRSGGPAVRSAAAVRRIFGRRLELVVGGATGGAARPSEIRDLLSGRVVRAG